MLCVKPRPAPVDYSKCNQVVTVYHKGDAGITRKVYSNAFLDFRKTRNVDKTGSKEANSFLLVIPCTQQCVFVGDKMVMGIGAEVTTQAQWNEMIPAKVVNLAVVKYADPKYWNGQMVHIEAGG